MNICLDTMILIWGVQHYSDRELINRYKGSEREVHQDRVIALGTWLEELSLEKHVTFTIPAPVVSEYLTWFKDPFEREDQLNKIKELATITPLNTPAAEFAGELYRVHRDSTGNKIKKSETPHIKVDSMIASIAHLSQCDCIVTHNGKDFSHYTKHIKPNVLGIDDLPRPPQAGLFDALPSFADTVTEGE